MRIARLGTRWQADFLQHRRHFMGAFGVGQVASVHAQSLGNDVPHRHPWRQAAVGVLKHNLRLRAHAAQRARRHRGEIATQQGDPPLRRNQPQQRRSDGGFAGPAFANQAHGLTGVHADIDAIDRPHRPSRPAQPPAVDGEADLQIPRLDQCRRPCFQGKRPALRLGGQQHLGVFVPGVGEHLGDRSSFDDLAVLHHANAVGVTAHNGKVVADQQQRQPTGGFLRRQQLQDLRLDGHIQRRRRLVGDQQGRIVCQRHRDHHPLALAAGKLMRKGVQPALGIGKPAFRQQCGDARAQAQLGHRIVQGNSLRHLLADAAERVEAGHRLLKHHASDTAAQASQQRVGGTDHRQAIQRHPATAGGPCRQKLQQRQRRERFAGAAFTDQRQRLTAIEAEGHVAHHLAPGKTDGEILNLDQTHFCTRRGSKASRTASPMKISSVSVPPSTTKAVIASHGDCRLSLP